MRTPGAVHAALRTATAALHRHGGTLPAGGPIRVDHDLSASFLEDLGVSGCAPLLAELPCNLVGGAGGPSAASSDLRRFLVTVSRPIASNPLLVEMLQTVPLEDMLDPTGADDEEVHRLAHHCLVLHLVTSACARSPRLAEAVFASVRSSLREVPHRLAPFERAKIFTVERSLELFSSHRLRRSSAPIPALFGQIGLPFNILEAVVQDACIDRLPNARAGAALMLARPGHKPASVSSDPRRVVRMHMPLGDEWQRLYMSWNLAFTSSWADAPYFASALLAPSVAGAPAEEFIFRRAYSLHMQICAQMRRRSPSDVPISSRVQALRDWRDERVSVLWGEINARAAADFHPRCVAAQKARWGERRAWLEELVGAPRGRPPLTPWSAGRPATSAAAVATFASGIAAAGAIVSNAAAL
jgi:hypothetical protein